MKKDRVCSVHNEYTTDGICQWCAPLPILVEPASRPQIDLAAQQAAFSSPIMLCHSVAPEVWRRPVVGGTVQYSYSPIDIDMLKLS